MNSSLESLVVRTEIRLGSLLVSIADSAYNMRDVDRSDEAWARAQAAYVRANRLLAQVVNCEREPLVRELGLLQNALSGLFEDQQSTQVSFAIKRVLKSPSVFPLEQLPRSLDANLIVRRKA